MRQIKPELRDQYPPLFAMWLAGWSTMLAHPWKTPIVLTKLALDRGKERRNDE